MMISPFTPLFFIDRKADGIDSDYIQTFASTDIVLLELLGTPGFKACVSVYSEPDHKRLYTATLKDWYNGNIALKFTELAFNPGYYSVGVRWSDQPDGNDHHTSQPFKVTDDPLELERTTLIQYSMRNNRQRNDAVFFINGMQRFFDLRVPGGFKDSNWTFGIESEQFTTQQADIAQLFGLESTQKKFTLGGSQGVPVWYGEMLNRILVCSHVYFDGVKYTRKGDNVPEMNVQLEGVNSFVFTQMLQQSVNLDPVIEQSNQILMRRVDTNHYRKATDTINRLI